MVPILLGTLNPNPDRTPLTPTLQSTRTPGVLRWGYIGIKQMEHLSSTSTVGGMNVTGAS